MQLKYNKKLLKGKKKKKNVKLHIFNYYSLKMSEIRNKYGSQIHPVYVKKCSYHCLH